MNFFLKQTDSTVLHEIQPYHHHQAFDLFSDLKLYEQKKAGIKNRIPREDFPMSQVEGIHSYGAAFFQHGKRFESGSLHRASSTWNN